MQKYLFTIWYFVKMQRIQKKNEKCRKNNMKKIKNLIPKDSPNSDISERKIRRRRLFGADLQNLRRSKLLLFHLGQRRQM